jgi:YcxB-like protein
VELKYNVTPEDLAAAEKFEERMWRRMVSSGPLVFSLRVLLIAATVFTIAMAIDLVRRGLVQRGHVAALVSLVLAAAALTGLWITVFRRMIKYATSGFTAAHRLVVDDDGVAVSNERGSVSIRWPFFVDVQETGHLIALVMDRRVCVFVPNRAFETDDARREFLTLARAKLAASAVTEDRSPTSHTTA